jgi:putative heme-binding domain-containing protein
VTEFPIWKKPLVTLTPLNYMSPESRPRPRWPWGTFCALAAAILRVVAAMTVAFSQVESRMDVVTGSTTRKTVWLFMMKSRSRPFWRAACLVLCSLLTPTALPADQPGVQYHVTNPALRLVTIDTDKTESFLSMALDGNGRLFVGAREGLFVYEPVAVGLYGPRQELYRFPKNTWVYDVVIRGHDLYVLTTSALYLFSDGVVDRTALTPRRLLWGNPLGHIHQGLHGMTIGPDGDLYISLGDELWYYGDFKRNPDHWGHWTLFHGPDNAPTPYTGDGGVLRLSPDGRELNVIANGTRNDCGLAFDAQWNLFGSDNDHESMPQAYVPGRLLQITPYAYFNWPRGWMIEKQPWRSDLLATLTPNLGRYVPVGMAYYNDTFLPAELRGSLYVPEWGSGKLAQYPLRAAGDTFAADEKILIAGQSEARPVGVAVGRGGRIFATICYMAHNDESPTYRSDLVMVTRADDPPEAPFKQFDEVGATTEQLFGELNSADWSRRYRAHIELTRRGPEATTMAANMLPAVEPGKPAAPHLIWLAAADPTPQTRAKIAGLTRDADADIRSTAVRALARFGADEGVFLAALRDPSPSVRHAALVGLFDQSHDLPFEPVATAACEDGTFIRQIAAFLLARRATEPQLRSLCESPDVKRRRAGILAVGFRLTVPEWNKSPDESIPLTPGNGGYRVTYAGGVTENLPGHGRMGNFTTADAWRSRAPTTEQALLFSLLGRRLEDADEHIAKQAAIFVRLLADPSNLARADELLGIPAAVQKESNVAIAGAKATGVTEMPEAFRKLDWSKEVLSGDINAGQKLFAARGCANCHAIKAGETGGGAPSLAAVGSRFSLTYILESVMIPNKVVAPEFRWTVAKLKGGDVISGLVTSQSGSEVEFLLPTGIHKTIQRADILTSRIEDRSPMPDGLIQTPQDMRDLLAFLVSVKE